ncbi:hypothetical protein WAI453_002268 [Rhynchosporium graminicola]
MITGIMLNTLASNTSRGRDKENVGVMAIMEMQRLNMFPVTHYFVAKGVTLVAITCEVPKQALSTAEKNKLKFPVLSDPGNKCAGELGLLFAMPEILTPAIESLGVDLKERNGDDSFVLLVPQTLLVERMGVVRMEPDYYSKRAEPETVLEWIDKL